MSAPAQEPQFSLRVLIREVVREQGIVNSPEARYAAAVEVARRTPGRYRADAFLDALTCLVREVVHHDRPTLRPISEPPDSGEGDLEGAADELAARRPRGKSANSANSSAQVAMRRIGRLMRSVYSAVPDKELGDYDPEDVEKVADYLEKVAADAALKAGRYRTVAAHMRVLGVKRVRDLPLDLLDETFWTDLGGEQ